MKLPINWLTINRTPRQTILKNTIWLFIGQVGSRVLRAVIVIYAARTLGASSWGAFSYALGIATFLTVFSDIGINGLLTKEGARNPETRDRYLGTALGIKIILLLVVGVSVILAFPHLTKIAEAARIMPILLFVFAFDTLRDLGSAFSRALEKMEIEAIIQVITNFIIVALGVIFLFFTHSSFMLALAYALGSGLGLIAIIIVLRKHMGRITHFFTPSLVKSILITAWPFGLMGMLGAVMLNSDIIMLGWLRSPEEVGYYSAAQKIIQMLYIVPTFFSSSIFPLMSRLVRENKEYATRILERSVAGIIMIAVPVTIIGLVLAKFIILTFFGEAYIAAVMPFQILMFTILLTYPAILIGNAIFAYDHQKDFVGYVVVATVGNIILNWLLIPRFGISGAATATLIVQAIIDSAMWYRLRRITGFSIRRGGRELRDILLSAKTKNAP